MRKHGKDKKAIQELKVSARQAKFLNVMIRNESKNRNTTCGLLHPDRNRLSTMFRVCFPSCTQEEVEAFSAQLTTKAGHGLVSKIQIEEFLYDRDLEESEKQHRKKESEAHSSIKRVRRYASPSEARVGHQVAVLVP